MPFLQIELEAPKPSKIPQILKTLGDHIRKPRLERGLLQKDVARYLGVDETTVYNWERNGTEPRLKYIPKVIEFLGYIPGIFKRKTIGERILVYRYLRGITQRALAGELDVDPSTLGRWERNERRPSDKLFEKLSSFFAGLCPDTETLRG